MEAVPPAVPSVFQSAVPAPVPGIEEAESVLRREQRERVLRERSEQLQRRNRRRNRIEAVTGRPAGREDGAPGNALGEAGERGPRGKGEAQHGTGAAPVGLPDFVPFSGFDDEDGLVVQSDGPRNAIGLLQVLDLHGGRAGIDAMEGLEPQLK